MKKTIRLTESDLIKIINRVIVEQTDGDDTNRLYSGSEYGSGNQSIGKYSYSEVTKDKLVDYLKWYEGTNYPEIQRYLMKTYGMPQLFNDSQLKTYSPKNKEFNVFKQFLNVVEGGLIISAQKNLNANSFIKTYNLEKLNGDLGGRFATLDWKGAFKEELPYFSDNQNKLKEFIGKVINIRRNAIGLNN